MDPAFSLADELAELHTHPHHPHYGNEDELEFHPHAYSGDEFAHDAYGSLDAELEAMHLGHRGSDLASELDGSNTGSLAAELDPSYHTAGMGSLGDELLYEHNDPSAAASSSTFASPHGVDSGTASPSRPARQAARTLSRSSDYSSGTASPSRWRNASGTSSTLDPTAAISQLAVAQTAELQESWSSTQQFLSQLATVSASSSSVDKSSRTAADTLAVADGEDTARLESAAAGYLKLVSECTVEREAQLRELRELDRKLARTLAEASPTHFGLTASTSWSSDLGGALSPSASSLSRALPDVDENDSFTRLPDSPTQLSHHHHRTTSLGSDTTVTDTLTLPVIPALVDGSLFQPLYTSTSALAASLAAVHEHTQITKSSSADAARKLKTLRGVLTQWRAELDSAEQSETWIERSEHAESVGKGWASEQVEWCRRRFEEAEGRARELLTPVSIAG